MGSAIYLIRHGETPWTLTKQHTGRADIPLTEAGVAQAEKLRPCLEGIEFAHVFSSPSKRARQTCEHAGFARCFPEPLIEEWDYGEFEGKTKVEIQKSWPDWNVFRHGCPGGEKPEDIMERADEVIARLARLEGSVALFSHGHFLRVLTTRWLDWPITHAQPLVLGPASVGVLGFEGAERALILWNRAEQDSPPKSRT